MVSNMSWLVLALLVSALLCMARRNQMVRKNLNLIISLGVPFSLALVVTWSISSGKVKQGGGLSDFILGISPLGGLAIWLLWLYWVTYPYYKATKATERDAAKVISLGRLKKTGWVIAVAGMIGVVVWYAYPRVTEWAKDRAVLSSTSLSTKLTTTTDPAARAVSSELGVVKKTTVLLPNSPPQKISFPPNVIGWWETSDCVKITDGLGETYDYCPGQKLDLGSNVPPTKAVLTFQHSKMDSEITVWYGWKLK